jgi:acyl-coenzyme A thioesterase PaaI-like protein
MDRPELVMDVAAMNDFLVASFPGAPRMYQVIHSDHDGVTLHIPFDESQIRPGGTISGPTMMAMADAAAWMATLARIGPVALSVTSSLTINFLAKPGQVALYARGRLLRLGRRQSVSEVRLWSDGGTPDEPVAFATVTYAIPASST